MKITKLTVQNFMRVEAVEITPEGALVTIGGRNAQGKTSVLQSIAALIGGKKAAPSEPVRKGASKAQIIGETEEFTVRRTFNPTGSTRLEVRAKDGGVFPSKQALLDKLYTTLTFDPLRFLRDDPNKQAETLRALVGLDFTKEDEDRQNAYNKRTEVNRECKRLSGSLAKLPEPPEGTPDEEASVAQLTDELERRRGVNAAHAKKRDELASLRERAVTQQDHIERLEQQLAEARQAFETLNTQGRDLRAEVDELVDEDVEVVRAQIATAEQTNAHVRAKRERGKFQQELNAVIDESERLTRYIDEIQEVKTQAIASAHYPIEGLRVDGDRVLLGEVPLDQASQAEQLRASVAIGLALNPELKVLLVRDGSLLDSQGLKLVAEMAEKAGGQVWLERVSDDGQGCSVLITEGKVQEQTQRQAG